VPEMEEIPWIFPTIFRIRIQETTSSHELYLLLQFFPRKPKIMLESTNCPQDKSHDFFWTFPWPSLNSSTYPGFQISQKKCKPWFKVQRFVCVFFWCQFPLSVSPSASVFNTAAFIPTYKLLNVRNSHHIW